MILYVPPLYTWTRNGVKFLVFEKCSCSCSIPQECRGFLIPNLLVNHRHWMVNGGAGEKSSCGDACLQTFNQVGSSLCRVPDTNIARQFKTIDDSKSNTFGTPGFSQHFSAFLWYFNNAIIF